MVHKTGSDGFSSHGLEGFYFDASGLFGAALLVKLAEPKL